MEECYSEENIRGNLRVCRCEGGGLGYLLEGKEDESGGERWNLEFNDTPAYVSLKVC